MAEPGPGYLSDMSTLRGARDIEKVEEAVGWGPAKWYKATGYGAARNQIPRSRRRRFRKPRKVRWKRRESDAELRLVWRNGRRLMNQISGMVQVDGRRL